MTRLTGFSPTVRYRIKERAGVEGDFVRCERCGTWVVHPPIHHRRPRGVGGSRRPCTNAASNGIATCTPCHAWAESERDEATQLGWLISQHRKNITPSEVPVLLHDGWCLLLDDGGRIGVPDPHRGVAS